MVSTDMTFFSPGKTRYKYCWLGIATPGLPIYRKGKSMKKLAIATALAALATTASAQSTGVYGVIDTGFQNYNNGATTFTRAGDNLLATSRLGFQGSEDLGGGLKAKFQLEGQINPSAGTMGATTPVAGEMFNREAWVGIAGSFGEIRLGRQDVSYAQDIDAGVSQFGNFGNRIISGANSLDIGTDQKSVIKYISPVIGGLQVQLGHASPNNNGATTDADTDQNSVYARYTVGKFTAHAGYQKNDGATAVAQRDLTVVGAAYDFGFASTGLSYSEGDTSTTANVKTKATQGSVKVPLANGFAVHGVYAMIKDGASTTDNKGTGYTVGVTKALSKRTTLYAAYSATDNQVNSQAYMAGQSLPAAAGTDVKTTSFGISHVF